MKSIHNKLLAALFFSILGGLCFSAQAAEDNFELYNKAKYEIRLYIKLGDEKAKYYDIPSEQAGQIMVPNDKPISLTVKDKDAVVNGKLAPEFSVKINPTGKTKYITFNPGKTPKLYPQTGPWLGLLGKTESGLSLKNNIQQSDLMPLSTSVK
jgi:hypothetical protein